MYFMLTMIAPASRGRQCVSILILGLSDSVSARESENRQQRGTAGKHGRE